MRFTVSLVLAVATVCSTAVLRSADPDVEARELPRVAATEPEDAMDTFRVRSGFHLELAASEPLIADPVALAFDGNGLLYVVEMRGYSERREDRLGRIKRLKDLDQDGRYEEATVFADDLAWPTAVTCWDGGVFVGATPDIWYFKDHDGDGVADEKRVVFTGFAHGVERLNVQAMLNSFQWGPDQRIHGATSFNGGRVTAVGVEGAETVELRGRDFSFDPRTLDIRPESGGGQHGMTFDDAGRKFVCSNSRHLMQVMYDDRIGSRPTLYNMPAAAVDIAVDGPAAEVFRISPDEPWRIVRTRWRIAGLVGGPVEGGGRVSGYFTGASGATVYRGDAWPEAFRGDAFIGDVGGNLVHHKRLSFEGLAAKAERPADERDHEFVASTDNWFRPVQFANAPDGCLYIADMYREVIEHPWSLPPSIKQHMDLNSGHDRGRIWRIAPDGLPVRRNPPRLGGLSTVELVRVLEHPNGWHRETASRLLHERRDAAAVEPLTELLARSPSPQARRHALQVLAGLDALREEHWRAAREDEDEQVRALGLRLWARHRANGSSNSAAFWTALAELARDPSPTVRYQLALSLGDFHDRRVLELLGELIRRDVGEPWMRSAVLHSIGSVVVDETKPLQAADTGLLMTLARDDVFAGRQEGRDFLRELALLTGLGGDATALAALTEWLAGQDELEPAASIVGGVAEGLRRSGGSLGESDPEGRLRPFFDRALSRVGDAALPEADRRQAVEVLGWRPDREAQAELWRRVRTDDSDVIRRAAWSSLRRQDEDNLAPALLRHWADLPSFVRKEGLEILLRSDSRAWRTLESVRQGMVAKELFSAAQKERLRGHRSEKIRRAAIEIFGRAQTVANRFEELRPALAMAGHAEAGQAIYRERCASCHRLGEEGHALGPDLATVKNGGGEKILLSLLDPNREVAPNYVQYDIETRDGEVLSGIIAGETPAGLTVKQANGLETFLVRASVEGMRSTGRSLMPEGLTEGLTRQDVADLLAFVLR